MPRLQVVMKIAAHGQICTVSRRGKCWSAQTSDGRIHAGRKSQVSQALNHFQERGFLPRSKADCG